PHHDRLIQFRAGGDPARPNCTESRTAPSEEEMAPELLRAPAGWTGAPAFIRSFPVPTGRGPVVAAHLDLTAEGLVEATLDGRATGPEVLMPGWTAYEWRLRVITQDVTALIGAPGAV